MMARAFREIPPGQATQFRLKYLSSSKSLTPLPITICLAVHIITVCDLTGSCGSFSFRLDWSSTSDSPNMAAIVTSSAVEMTNGKTGSDATEKAHKSKPEKPDEEKYKLDLAKAEKEYAAAMDKFVSLLMDACI